ncbi:hypothetical protein J6590_077234 [Homalodisca vitripennis]|nr:hypothetical protein J6590_077234 [Homalodisca vitripennis]
MDESIHSQGDVSECDGMATLTADSILEEVYNSKFLGIHLDRGLTWNDHIDHVCA